MQTFLPYKSFKESFKTLDYQRLGKQRVEAFQVLNVLLGRTTTGGWRNHPITKMWKGYENALKEYLNECIDEWVDRGYNNTMKHEVIEGDEGTIKDELDVLEEELQAEEEKTYQEYLIEKDAGVHDGETTIIIEPEEVEEASTDEQNNENSADHPIHHAN